MGIGDWAQSPIPKRIIYYKIIYILYITIKNILNMNELIYLFFYLILLFNSNYYFFYIYEFIMPKNNCLITNTF